MTLHELFTTDTTGLAEVTPSSSIRLHHGDRFDLRIAPVRKTLNGADLRMLAYNGSIPGPTLHVDQDSEITVHIAPFRKSGPTFSAMGRSGNVMLINAETEFSAEVAQGELCGCMS